MIKVYGVSMSRAFRPLWLLEELGVAYEHVPTNMADGGTRTPEFLAVNPNGHVPALADGDTVLWESMAINLYLAKKYDGGLQPKTVEDEGHALKWSFWVMTEVEGPILEVLFNRVIRPEAERDAAVADKAEAQLAAPLAVLNGALEGKSCLLGDAFTVADLNVASVLLWGKLSRMDLSKWANVERWLGACLSRPAVKRAQGK
jgi:glutathione S-transferase